MPKGTSGWNDQNEADLLNLIAEGYNFNQVSKMLCMDRTCVTRKFETLYQIPRETVDWRKAKPMDYMGSFKKNLTAQQREQKARMDRLYPDKKL